MFESVFKETLQQLKIQEKLIMDLWSDIAAHYSDAQRHYHNLAHLDHLTQELLKVKNNIANWDIIVCSVAYHDVIYDISRPDNEEKSAEYAGSQLSAHITSAQVQKCCEAIRATKAHQFHKDPDINYFTDADLSILGTNPGLYVKYTEQIRREYNVFPDLIYKPGRKKVLEHFLYMEHIFKTPFFYTLYEKQARANLQTELNSFTA